MKKGVILLAIFLLVNHAFSQNEVYEKVVSEFEINYNSDNFEKIFLTFSREMQAALPLDKTVSFLSNLKSRVGKIISSEFIEFQNGAFASYKTSFESVILSLNVSVDESNKINGLLFKPFQEQKDEENKVVNALDLPKEQNEIIFNKTKSFPDKTQIAIAFIENGVTKFYGIIKENDTIKFIGNKDKVFEIGSVSKVFTSTVLAALVLEKKINLEDEINVYYNFSFKDNIKLDFKTLANHTSGLERLPSNLDLSEINAGNPYASYDENKLNSYLKEDLRLAHSIGEKYEYSNLGTGLLGYTLGVSQKSSYDALLNNYIFKKYKMNASHTNRSNAGLQMVKGLDENGNEVENWDFDVLSGAGGIISSVSDMSKFINAQFDPQNRELALTRIPTFIIDEEMKIGLGWHIISSAGLGKEIYWHNGGTGGYSSSVAIDIKNKNGIIVLSNVSSFNAARENIDSLCFELLDNLK
jgi:CubicO group peptidase (beta-lactamase class C family)